MVAVVETPVQLLGTCSFAACATAGYANLANVSHVHAHAFRSRSHAQLHADVPHVPAPVGHTALVHTAAHLATVPHVPAVHGFLDGTNLQSA